MINFDNIKDPELLKYSEFIESTKNGTYTGSVKPTDDEPSCLFRYEIGEMAINEVQDEIVLYGISML